MFENFRKSMRARIAPTGETTDMKAKAPPAIIFRNCGKT